MLAANSFVVGVVLVWGFVRLVITCGDLGCCRDDTFAWWWSENTPRSPSVSPSGISISAYCGWFLRLPGTLRYHRPSSPHLVSSGLVLGVDTTGPHALPSDWIFSFQGCRSSYHSVFPGCDVIRPFLITHQLGRQFFLLAMVVQPHLVLHLKWLTEDIKWDCLLTTSPETFRFSSNLWWTFSSLFLTNCCALSGIPS